MKKILYCPICHKVIGKLDEDGEMKKAYLWCRRCKREIYINKDTDIKNKLLDI